MSSAEESKSRINTTVLKEKDGEDYTSDMQSLGRVLLAMCTLEDTNSVKSDQYPQISALYS